MQRGEKSSQRATAIKVGLSDLVLTWVGKEPGNYKNESVFNQEPFTVDEVPETQYLLNTSLDPQVLEMTERDPNLKHDQDRVIWWIHYYVEQY